MTTNDILAKERIGKVNKNTYGTTMEVVEYNRTNDILIKFDQGNTVNTTWGNFKSGIVKNPYDKTIYGVGYLGEGEYKPYINLKKTPEYASWSDMLKRCYTKKCQNKQPSYIDCSVIDEWHNFQTYAKWFHENYYKIEGERVQLDKDILIKNNNVYSPNTCILAPQRINLLFVKRNADRGDYPLGVGMVNGKYFATCAVGKGKSEHLGSYISSYEAFNAYKVFKEYLIKQVAEEYKDKIPVRLYEAMVKYEVEITD